AEALARLESEPSIALVLSDIRMPDSEGGVAFIRTVRRRWPDLSLAAVTGFPEDLAMLHGTDEYPVLTIPKPFRAHQIDDARRLGRGGRRPPARARVGVGTEALVTDAATHPPAGRGDSRRGPGPVRA